MDPASAPRRDVIVEPLADDEATALLDALDAAEAAAGAPLVDEAERLRLEALAGSRSHRADGWLPLVAHGDTELLGYAGAVRDRDGSVRGDAAVVPSSADETSLQPEPTTILRALLENLASTAVADGAARLEVWVRHADGDTLEAGRSAGFDVQRRLGVLGRDLEDASYPDVPAGVEVRPYRPDEDDEQVVAVLAAAYDGTAEAGWDRERFVERRSWPWFRPEDLLVADLEHGHLGGIHWLKRRSDDVGEVYNLAIHPDAQGRGLGPALLNAGLAHLREVGCDEVVLWVDLANERAVRMYRSQGFTTRWEDVAFTRTLDDPARS